MESNGLIEFRKIGGQKRFFPANIATDIMLDLEKIDTVDFRLPTNIDAQLKYGLRSGWRKDTRRKHKPSVKIVLKSETDKIIWQFSNTVSQPAKQCELDEFLSKMEAKEGFTRKKMLDALGPILSDPVSHRNAHLIKLSRGGRATAAEFEKALTLMFRAEFGYDTEWTGRRYSEAVGGFMDIFVSECGGNRCGIIDAKSMSEYNLNHSDCAKASATYVPNFHKLCGDISNPVLAYMAYVSYGFSSGAIENAKWLYSETRTPVSLISVHGLLAMMDDVVYKGNPRAVTDRLSRD